MREVYDPFMGRGTTPVQAALMGRKPMGNDINPLSVLLARPRLTPPTLAPGGAASRDVGLGRRRSRRIRICWPSTRRRHSNRITALRRWLIERAPLGSTPDPVDDWIRMVAMNRLTGHSPGFFSVYTLPPKPSGLRSGPAKNKRGAQPVTGRPGCEENYSKENEVPP